MGHSVLASYLLTRGKDDDQHIPAATGRKAAMSFEL
jgi:hypothetical protein